MKPLVLSCLAVCLFISSNAQKSSVWLRAGLNLAKVSVSGNGEIESASMRSGWQIGLMGDIPFSKYFSLQPGVAFTGKGSKIKGRAPYEYEGTANPRYIEISTNAVLKSPGSPGNADFFIGLGPYAAIGVAGKRDIQGTFFGTFDKRKTPITYTNDEPSTFQVMERAGLGVMRRLDYGFNATGGFIFKGFTTIFNYGFGLAKLQSGKDSENGRYENRVVSVLIGVKL